MTDDRLQIIPQKHDSIKIFQSNILYIDQVRMIDSQSKLILLQTLNSSPLFSDNTLDTLPDKKIKIWKIIKSRLKKSIEYNFDDFFQQKAHAVLHKVDQILKTNQFTELKSFSLQKIKSFPKTLVKVIQDYQELQEQQTEKLELPELREALMDSVFAKELQYWTFSELASIVSKKWNSVKGMKFYNMNPYQKEIYDACKKFNQFYEETDLDFSILDTIIEKRIGLKSNDSVNSSQLSQIPQILESSTVSQLNPIDESTEINMNSLLTSLNTETIIKQDQKLPIKKIDDIKEFSRKEQEKNFKGYDEKISEPIKEFKNILSQKNLFLCSQQKVGQKKNSRIIKENDMIRVNNPELKPFLKADESQESLSFNHFDSFVSFNQQKEQESLLVDNAQNITQRQSVNFYRQYSKAIIDRYENQNRFTEGKYRYLRENEVRKIVNTQCRPLIELLQKLPLKDIDINSSSNFSCQKIQIYGSFANKCGFRILSDLNINISADSILQKQIGKCLNHLKSKLDSCKDTALKTLKIRSVVIPQEHSEIIIIHQNHQSNIKDQNNINFIYITLNKKQYTFSSRFIKEVVYNREQKNKEIAHLFNFLHLIFKKNQILDHKNIYHPWLTHQNPHQIQKKKLSQSRYVSISVYALHMMILFYLQKTNKITPIKYVKDKKAYQFTTIDNKSTLYEKFIGFLEFYSQNGQHHKKYAYMSLIDVVSRSKAEQNHVFEEIVFYLQNKETETHQYLFSLIHPMIIQLVNQDFPIQKCISFELKKGSEEEKLFFKKIGEIHQRAIKAKDKYWDANDVFDKYPSKIFY